MVSAATKARAVTSKDLENQIAELRNEIAEISGMLSRQGFHVLDSARDTASDVYDLLRTKGAKAAHVAGRQVHYVADTARERPVASIVILVGVGLIIGGLLARR